MRLGKFVILIKKKDVLIKVDDGVRHGDALRVLHFHHRLLLLGFALMFCQCVMIREQCRAECIYKRKAISYFIVNLFFL